MGVHQLLRYATDNFFKLKDQYDWLLFSTLMDDNARQMTTSTTQWQDWQVKCGLDTLFTH